MAVIYLLVALYVVIVHITEVPGVLALIVKSAFGFEEAAGGIAGGVAAAMLNGVKRGLFSNEAGMGSAPNIAAVATPDPHHPVLAGHGAGARRLHRHAADLHRHGDHDPSVRRLDRRR